ncbi:MAG: hypothetical protein RL038_440 [Actinomycetota bacterium]|jgi:signal peptidase I
MLRRGVKQLTKIGIGLVSSFVLLYIAALLSLRISGFEYAVVASNSMLPHAARGDLVILDRTISPRLGDVVTFARGNTIVMHRLHALTTSGEWKTKGDNNLTADPWRIKSRDIRAEAVGRLAGFGWPLLWATPASLGDTVSSSWTRDSVTPAAVTSKTMTSSSFTLWTKFSTLSFYTVPTSGALRISSSGERRLYSRVLCANLCRIHLEGNLSLVDPAKPYVDFLFNSCPDSLDNISCGWVVRVKNLAIELRLISTDGEIGSVLESCSPPATFSISSRAIYSISRGPSGFLVTLNGEPCRLGQNLLSVYPSGAFQNPNGDRIGFWLTGSNRWTSEKTAIRAN